MEKLINYNANFGFTKIINQPVDWWTIGILIYEMHAGIDPFNVYI